MPTTTRPSRRAEDELGASSQRFVDAALDLFIEHGFRGTSLQMIGDRLGVSKAAVTYHFPSKDELLLAVVRPSLEDLSRVLDQVESVKRESARRRQTLHAYVDHLIRHRRVTSWLARDVSALTHETILETAEGLGDRIDRLLTDSAGDALAQVWGAAIVQALTGPVLTPTDLSDEALRTELELIGEQLMRGYQSSRRRAAADA